MFMTAFLFAKKKRLAKKNVARIVTSRDTKEHALLTQATQTRHRGAHP